MKDEIIIKNEEIQDIINNIEQVRRDLNDGRGCDHEREKLRKITERLREIRER